MGRSVAFKCTYNDGGQGAFVGFAGTCSLDNITYNVESSRPWCSSAECDCRGFYDQGMKGKKPVEPCMESVLFSQWEFGAGGFLAGPRKGQPVRLRDTEPGRFAVLTARFPREPESERRITGLFQIDRIRDQNTLVAKPK